MVGQKTSLFSVLLGSKHFWHLFIKHEKGLYLSPQCFYFFFLILGDTPIPVPWWMPSNGPFFSWGFLSLPGVLTIVPLDKFIIIAILIVVMPYFYLLICYNNHRYFLTAFLHISRVLNQSGTTSERRGPISLALMWNISLAVACNSRPHHIFLGGYKHILACTTRQSRPYRW